MMRVAVRRTTSDRVVVTAKRLLFVHADRLLLLLLIILAMLIHLPPSANGVLQTSKCDQTFRSEAVSNGSFKARSTLDLPTSASNSTEEIWRRLRSGADDDELRTCHFRFRAEQWKVVWIDWHEFELEASYSDLRQCQRDYVEVIVTDYQRRQHVSGRYCGQKRPPPLHSVQAIVDIRYHLAPKAPGRRPSRFSATFHFLDEAHVPGPSSFVGGANAAVWSDACGGSTWDRASGIIYNPGYPNTYPAQVECNWLIRVRRGHRVYVRLLELELVPTRAECDRAALYIIDGYKHVLLKERKMHNGTIAYIPTVFKKVALAGTGSDDVDVSSQVRFCGEESYYKDEGQKSYISQWNRIIVSFVTKYRPMNQTLKKKLDVGKPVGFRLIWTEISAVQNEMECGDNFYCRGGSLCLRGTGVCSQRRSLCVDRNLVCDGRPNCAEGDESDEENCYALPIVGAGATLFALLALVIVAVIVYQRQSARTYMATMRAQFQQQQQSNLATPAVTASLADTAVHNNIQKTKYQNSLPYHHVDRPDDEDHSLLKLKALPHNYVGFDSGGEDEPFICNHVGPGASTSGASSSSAAANVHRRLPRSQRVEFHKEADPTPYLGQAEQRPVAIDPQSVNRIWEDRTALSTPTVRQQPHRRHGTAAEQIPMVEIHRPHRPPTDDANNNDIPNVIWPTVVRRRDEPRATPTPPPPPVRSPLTLPTTAEPIRSLPPVSSAAVVRAPPPVPPKPTRKPQQAAAVILPLPPPTITTQPASSVRDSPHSSSSGVDRQNGPPAHSPPPYPKAATTAKRIKSVAFVDLPQPPPPPQLMSDENANANATAAVDDVRTSWRPSKPAAV